CSVTAGRPNGHLTATRRKARGERPSCCSTTARSFTAVEASVRLPPALDALHDEQPLTWLDKPDSARLACELGIARRRGNQLLQVLMLLSQLPHLGAPHGHGVARVEVHARRLVVEDRDEASAADDDPAQEAPGVPGTCASTRSHGRKFAAVNTGPATRTARRRAAEPRCEPTTTEAAGFRSRTKCTRAKPRARSSRAEIADFWRKLGRVHLDDVRGPGDVDLSPGRDHDAVSGLDEPGVAHRGDREVPEVLDVRRLGDPQRRHAPLHRHLLERVLMVAQPGNRPPGPEASD